MTPPVALVLILTFVVNLIGALALAVRLVGIRTNRWSVAYALFNIMVVFSRLANTLQAPILAKTVELNIRTGRMDDIGIFRLVMASATVATVISMFFLPSFQRMLGRAVERYYDFRSLPKLVFYSLRWRSIRRIPTYLKWPDRANIRHLQNGRVVSLPILILNMLASAALTVGVLATLYAGHLNPTLRSTSASMSGAVNGLSTMLAALVIDPDIALLTDEVVAGQVTNGAYRRYLAQILVARLAGTLLAQALLLPAAHAVVWAAEALRV